MEATWVAEESNSESVAATQLDPNADNKYMNPYPLNGIPKTVFPRYMCCDFIF